MLDGLIVIGGNGTLTVAQLLYEQLGIPIVGVPKTIDNDIEGTDVTFGFHTAVQIATDAIDRLHTTAESHDRVMLVEVMGRHTGWIATYAGIAGGATVILVPEQPFDIDEVCKTHPAPPHARSLRVDRRRGRGCRAEGGHDGADRAPIDQHGHAKLGGIAYRHRAARSSSAPASRPGSWCSATSSGAVRPTPTTGCCRPATGWPPSTPSTSEAWGQMVVFREQRIERAPMRCAWAGPARSTWPCTRTWRESSSGVDRAACTRPAPMAWAWPSRHRVARLTEGVSGTR